MTIDAIRKKIHHNVGNNIKIFHNEGRNKITRYEGKVIEVYRNIFIVMDRDGKKSFSYYDILTQTVKISFKM